MKIDKIALVETRMMFPDDEELERLFSDFPDHLFNWEVDFNS